MSLDENKKIPFGKDHNGVQHYGTIKNLTPPKGYHYSDMDYSTAKVGYNSTSQSGKKTIGDRKIISDDVEKITEGKVKHEIVTKRNGESSRFTLSNGRSYEVGPNGILFPKSGPKLQQLNKQQFKALETLNKHGPSVKSQIALSRQGISRSDAKVVINVWQQNKGKKVNPKTVEGWQTGLERKLPKDRALKIQNIDKKRGR